MGWSFSRYCKFNRQPSLLHWSNKFPGQQKLSSMRMNSRGWWVTNQSRVISTTLLTNENTLVRLVLKAEKNSPMWKLHQSIRNRIGFFKGEGYIMSGIYHSFFLFFYTPFTDEIIVTSRIEVALVLERDQEFNVLLNDSNFSGLCDILNISIFWNILYMLL